MLHTTSKPETEHFNQEILIVPMKSIRHSGLKIIYDLYLWFYVQYRHMRARPALQ